MRCAGCTATGIACLIVAVAGPAQIARSEMLLLGCRAYLKMGIRVWVSLQKSLYEHGCPCLAGLLSSSSRRERKTFWVLELFHEAGTLSC